MGRRNEKQKMGHREDQKRYYERHPDRVRETNRRYRENHKEKIKSYYTSPKVLEYKRNLRAKQNAKSIDECDKELYRKRWTEEEEDFLIANYSMMTVPQLSEVMGRTIMSIERKRNRLGLTKEVADE